MLLRALVAAAGPRMAGAMGNLPRTLGQFQGPPPCTHQSLQLAEGACMAEATSASMLCTERELAHSASHLLRT